MFQKSQSIAREKETAAQLSLLFFSSFFFNEKQNNL